MLLQSGLVLLQTSNSRLQAVEPTLKVMGGGICTLSPEDSLLPLSQGNVHICQKQHNAMSLLSVCVSFCCMCIASACVWQRMSSMGRSRHASMQLQAADALLPHALPHLCALIVLNKEGQSMEQMALDSVEAERERIISAGQRRGSNQESCDCMDSTAVCHQLICAFKPGCLMSHNWLHTPDCK